jgi:outer membrane translocation and assembly module TamA
MFTGQAEFRIPIVDKFGAVAFGGLGAVEPSFSDLAMDQLLPAGGVGLRYLVWESWHVKVGADVAWGRNGAAFYLRLGEAY